MTDEDEMAEALRAKWGVQPEEIAQRQREEKSRAEHPVPVRVEVERIFEGRSINGMQCSDEPQHRFFFYGIDHAGARRPLTNTKNEAAAKREVAHWQKLGIPVEVKKR